MKLLWLMIHGKEEIMKELFNIEPHSNGPGFLMRLKTGEIDVPNERGGYTIIPELHMNFLSDEQKKNTAYLNMDKPTQRRVSILIKVDFIRERILNAVLGTLNTIIPENMIEEIIKKGPIRLK